MESADIELEDNENEMNALIHQHGDTIVTEDDMYTSTEKENNVNSPVDQTSNELSPGKDRKRTRESLGPTPMHPNQYEGGTDDADQNINTDVNLISEHSCMHTNDEDNVKADSVHTKKKSKTKISAEEYRNITTMIILHLKQLEEERKLEIDAQSKTEDEISSNLVGTLFSDVVVWYLNEVSLALLSFELYLCFLLLYLYLYEGGK